jgi:hypothetical protein
MQGSEFVYSITYINIQLFLMQFLVKSKITWRPREIYTLVPCFSRVPTLLFRKFEGSPPRIKIHHSDPSMDRSIEIGQREQLFQPCRLMFKEVKEKKI